MLWRGLTRENEGGETTDMDDFLSEEACVPNLNAATIAGKVTEWKPLKISESSGKITALSFTVGYQKTWPNGAVQTIPIRCYVTGEERIEKLGWLKPDEVVLVRGEITNTGSIYALQLEWLSRPEREPGEDDAYLAGMLTSKED
jgi:hypothetical protein